MLWQQTVKCEYCIFTLKEKKNVFDIIYLYNIESINYSYAKVNHSKYFESLSLFRTVENENFNSGNNQPSFKLSKAYLFENVNTIMLIF